MPTHLSLGDEDRNSVVLGARRKGVIGNAFLAQLVPDRDKIMALMELNLVGDKSSTILLVSCVLEVPVALLLLDEAAHWLLVLSRDAILGGTPDLQILNSVSILVLGGPLPGDEVGATRREANLEDVENRQVQDLLARCGIDDGDSVGGSVPIEATAGGVFVAPSVSFRLGEPSERLVGGSSIEERNALLGSGAELQRRRHG